MLENDADAEFAKTNPPTIYTISAVDLLYGFQPKNENLERKDVSVTEFGSLFFIFP